MGDASRLLQVLVNLVGNALKFTKAGRVQVNMTCPKSGAGHILIRVEVEDTGIGVEPAALGQLFQPFHQADSSTTRRFGGTGLGLSISRDLVGLMGGSIGVTSTVGEGSTFWFEIPFDLAANAANLPPVYGAAEPAAPWLRGVRVLVVDDCDVICECVRRILEDQGAIVTCCSDGASAVEYVHFHHHELDIVLIDVQMPILDGNAATRLIRSDLGLKTLPIIGLTAGAMRSEQQRSLDAGMNDIITKPFDPQTMLSGVRPFVGQPPGPG
jgi:CheY-like chemotaxis protein